MAALKYISTFIWALNKIVWRLVVFVGLLALLAASVVFIYILWTGYGKETLWKLGQGREKPNPTSKRLVTREPLTPEQKKELNLRYENLLKKIDDKYTEKEK